MLFKSVAVIHKKSYVRWHGCLVGGIRTVCRSKRANQIREITCAWMDGMDEMESVFVCLPDEEVRSVTLFSQSVVLSWLRVEGDGRGGSHLTASP